MTITLAPQVETRLRRKAARMGQEADALAGALLWDALADEATEAESVEEASVGEMRAEYQHLVTLELKGALSNTQATRLRQVTQELDDLDMHSPAAQAMSLRLDETGRKFDEIRCLTTSALIGTLTCARISGIVALTA